MIRGQMLKQAMLIVLALAQLMSGYAFAEFGGRSNQDRSSSMIVAGNDSAHCGQSAADRSQEAPDDDSRGSKCVSHSSCCCASGYGTLPSVLTSLTSDASDALPHTASKSYREIPPAVELHPPRCFLRSA